ncbi:nucleoside diphosphate kinase 3 isoform X4 [Lepidochelys kempii]|uniref:nucleoside diphosphate kinase 3 isoform X4 n=1 Tax=Lepidochelys kempii TaxID=8472 RepID=UPI003C705F41
MICSVLILFANIFHSAFAIYETSFTIQTDACTGVNERTFLAIKPDGVQRHLIGEIIRRFEKKGFKLVGMKLMQVWQGLDVVKMARAMIGETNPADSRPGTIRGDFCIEVSKNVIHGSDSIESARREISLWFHTDKLTCWADSTEHWIYE